MLIFIKIMLQGCIYRSNAWHDHDFAFYYLSNSVDEQRSNIAGYVMQGTHRWTMLFRRSYLSCYLYWPSAMESNEKLPNARFVKKEIYGESLLSLSRFLVSIDLFVKGRIQYACGSRVVLFFLACVFGIVRLVFCERGLDRGLVRRFGGDVFPLWRTIRRFR